MSGFARAVGARPPQSPEAEPGFLRTRRWIQKPSPKAEVGHSRQAAPPAWAPLTAGPTGATALTARLPLPALRAARASPGAAPAWPGPRARDGLRALPARPRPARVRSQPLGVRFSSRAGRAAAAAVAARAPPSGRGGEWGGKREARRELPGGARALPREERGRCPARCTPLPARARRAPELGASGTEGARTPGSEGSRLGPRWLRIGTTWLRALPRPASPESLAPPSSERCALRATDAGTEGWPQPGPAGPQGHSDPQRGWERRCALGATPKAEFWDVLGRIRAAVFSSFFFFFSIAKELGIFLPPEIGNMTYFSDTDDEIKTDPNGAWGYSSVRKIRRVFKVLEPRPPFP